MIINHDLSTITGRTDIKINAEQKEFLKSVVEGQHQQIILWGTSGVGKTILAWYKLTNKCQDVIKQQLINFSESLLVKTSKYRLENGVDEEINVFMFTANKYATQLRDEFEEKMRDLFDLPNLAYCFFSDLQEFYKEEKIGNLEDFNEPADLHMPYNKVITHIGSKYKYGMNFVS